MIPSAFDYRRPATVEEALDALTDPEAQVLAGGHSLLPMMKLRLARPATLVDISRLDLRGVQAHDGQLRIGALTTYDELLDAGVPLPDALREAVFAVGDAQVRNAGTVGGALAHADPASDVAAAALALGARLVLRSPEGTRELPVDSFFLGPFTTALGEQELLTEIVVPLRWTDAGSAYVAFEDRASGYPLAGAAVMAAAGELSVALTGLAAHPQRVPEVERALAAGQDPAAAMATFGVLAAPEDADHRRQLAVVAIRRAAERARARARGGD